MHPILDQQRKVHLIDNCRRNYKMSVVNRKFKKVKCDILLTFHFFSLSVDVDSWIKVKAESNEFANVGTDV